MRTAAARATLGPACGDLLRWLEEHAVTQSDGRRVVWHGSAEIARLTDKAPGTLTQQIGQLRLAGHVINSRRGHIELAPSDHATEARPDVPASLADVISTLAALATDYPEHREGLAAAIATVSRESRTESRDIASRRGISYISKVEEEVLSSSDQISTRYESRNANNAFAIRNILAPLVELERRTNPRAQVPATIANELADLVTLEELRSATRTVLPMLERGEIKTGIGLIVARAREHNMDIFRPAPPPGPAHLPTPEPSAPSAPPNDIEDQDIPDPDVEQFLQLTVTEADAYRRAALASSGAFRPILEEHPAALNGAAAELWRRTCAEESNSGRPEHPW